MNDAPGSLDDKLRGMLLTMRIVVGVLIAGSTVFLGFAIVRRSMAPQPPRDPVIALVGVAFAVGAPIAAAIVPNLVRRQWERQVAAGMWPGSAASQYGPAVPATPVEEVEPDQETMRWWGVHQTVLILRCGLLEGAAFLQGLAYLVEGNLFSLPLGFAMIGLILMQWPTRERLDRWVEARREAVDQIRGGALS
jgi:hypothetical protein